MLDAAYEHAMAALGGAYNCSKDTYIPLQTYGRYLRYPASNLGTLATAPYTFCPTKLGTLSYSVPLSLEVRYRRRLVPSRRK